MASRRATIPIGRPFLFRPFTSITTSEQSSKTPGFKHLIPHEADSDFIQLRDAKWPSRRFVYVFLSQESLAPEDTLKGQFERSFLRAKPEANPLLVVIRVEPNGKQSLSTGPDFKDALSAGLAPDFVAIKEVELASVEPEKSGEELIGSYAVAAPLLLTLEAIEQLEKGQPAGVPILGTGMGLGVEGPLAGATPANAQWVFPVVDPLLIAENLTRKYNEACDNFLAASQNFERPRALKEEMAARELGEIQRLKKVIADNLLALKNAAPQVGSAFSSNLDPGFPEAFLEEYDEFLQQLAFERERAAFHVIAWIESEIMALADDWWPRDDSKPAQDYDVYVSSIAGALSRMIESDRGVAYLSDLRRRSEEGSSPVASGVLHVISEYVLRETQSSDEQRVLATKISTRLFSVWGAFVAASLVVKQRLVKGPNPNTTLGEDLERFAKRIQFIFHDGFITVTVDPIDVDLTPPGGVKKSVVSIPARTLGVPSGMKSALNRAQVSTEHVGRVCAVLNFGLAYAALRNTLAEQGDTRARDMALSDLAGAGLGVVDNVVALPALEGFRNRLAGKVNMGGALLGNRAAGTLGLLGAIASLTSASFATAEELDRGDWNKAMAHMTEGFGAVLMGAGFTIILISGTTGPFALWTIGVGTAVNAAGFIWSVFAADTEIEQMLKFCAFGQQKGQAAIKPPGWSQCSQTFAEWNPKTVDGLTRQLRAFQQIFYAFEAQGADSSEPGPLASDGILRIVPSSLRVKSLFTISYTAVYVTLQVGSRTRPVTLSGEAIVSISSSSMTFEDKGLHYQTTGAVKRRQAEGRDAIDVRFRLITRLKDDLGRPMELDSLTCLVQLRVPGAAAEELGKEKSTLIVPTTAGGAKKLKIVAMEDHRPTSKTGQSVKV